MGSPFIWSDYTAKFAGSSISDSSKGIIANTKTDQSTFSIQ
jgi:hypothetical protein